MRTGIILLIAAVLAFSLAACNSVPTPEAANPDEQRAIAQNENTAQQNEAQMQRFDAFVKLNASGQFALDPTASSQLDAASLSALKAWIAAANAESVSSTSSDPALSPQGNSNGYQGHWWGFRIALDDARTRRVIAWLNSGGDATSILGLIPGPIGIAAKVLVGLRIVAKYALTYCNRNHQGVYIYHTWAGGWWCRGQ